MMQVKAKLEHGLFLAILLLITGTILQDFLAAVLLDRGFFISESLLFKTVWMIFLPTVAGLWYGLESKFIRSRPVWQYLLLALLLTGFHLILAGALISGIARFAMMLPFTFSGVEKYLIAHQGPVVLLFYVLVLGGINYFQAKEEEKDSGGTLAQKYIDHIPVRQGRRVIPIAIGKILWIQAESPYSCLYTYEGKYLIHTSLKQLQTALDPEVMVRIHRSTIVNVNRIQELRSRSNGDYDVLLQNGKLLRWSRNYPGHLKELLRLTQ